VQGRRNAIWSLNKSARRLGLPTDLLSQVAVEVEAWVSGRVHLRPPSWRDEPKRQLTYVVVTLSWATAVWVLLTNVTLIRAMQGKAAEELLVETWGLGLLFEQVRRPPLQLLWRPPPAVL
jgi:branched-subunit amino acid ABC-type transport system permease component